jgi:hypothetical protein
MRWRGAIGIGRAASEGGRARCGNGGDVGYSEVHGREGGEEMEGELRPPGGVATSRR